MARERQYDDPISIPFTFPIKARIVALAEYPGVAQADVVRMCVDAHLGEVEKQLAARHGVASD